MEVLIIGAGVAGLALAAKLLQQGRTPVVIERDTAFGDKGYAFGMYPLGSCVLHGLGKYPDLLDRGVVAKSYKISDGRGRLLQDVDLSSFAGDIGPMIMVSRTALMEILQEAAQGADLRMGTTAAELRQMDGRVVEATFADGKSETFDLVLGCDGMHSTTRKVVSDAAPDILDTEWVLWTWWADMPDWPRQNVQEYWGAGRFFGVYPTPEHVMCCGGMHKSQLTVDPADVAAAKTLLKEQFEETLKADERLEPAIDAATHIFAWPMTDARAMAWRNGRVGLCGDAAAGFLPTAGAGANSAIRSAASLADELSRVDGQIAPLALELFEKRCRTMVEKNQEDSRRLAKYIFVENAALAWGRDEIVKHTPMTKMVGDIINAMHNPF